LGATGFPLWRSHNDSINTGVILEHRSSRECAK
jgi:hypothetical protein